MRKSCSALFGIFTLTSVFGASMAIPTQAAELPVLRPYKRTPALFSYPYGGTYLRIDYAKRRLGYPYTGFY